MTERDFEAACVKIIEEQLVTRGIVSEGVLDAMLSVPGIR